jgi:hypothetical protein
MSNGEPGVLEEWAALYRAEAKADDYQIVIAEMDKDGEDHPVEMGRNRVEATTQFVAYLLACRQIDGVDHDPTGFLKKQVYDPKTATARYRFDFLRPQGLAVLYADELHEVDLADLFNGPGYYEFKITHTDGTPFDAAELDVVEQWIAEDFEYDFEPDEFTYEIARSSHCVQVLDIRET